jgi:hypothetical protein
MSHTIPRGRWCDIIILNVHAPTQNKNDDMKKLEHVFHRFHQYHMKILLGYFNTKVGTEDILKSTMGNESLH